MLTSMENSNDMYLVPRIEALPMSPLPRYIHVRWKLSLLFLELVTPKGYTSIELGYDGGHKHFQVKTGVMIVGFACKTAGNKFVFANSGLILLYDFVGSMQVQSGTIAFAHSDW